MAIYRLSAEVVKRSGGRSVVACAAYRAGESLEDERTGQDLRLQPQARRAARGDHHAKRKDAQLAREVLLALPHELTDTQRAELLEKFVCDEVSKGMVADIAIHAPGGRTTSGIFMPTSY